MTHLEQVKDKIKHFPSLDELKHFIDIPEYYEEGEPDAYKEGYQAGIESGALWQKEQHKQLYEAGVRALDYLSVKYPKESEILHELKKAIESY